MQPCHCFYMNGARACVAPNHMSVLTSPSRMVKKEKPSGLLGGFLFCYGLLFGAKSTF